MAVRIAFSLGFGGRRLEMMMGSNFSPGTAVEMNPDEERLFNAWFPAIYLGQLGIDSFLLQCKKSNNSDVKIVVRGAIRFGLSLQIRLKEILACWIKLMHSTT
ncbi:hypothetical protein C1H46_018132 [Malus baccata]|uniref:Uncharacterized protein n=1 Tax=Malus baccata TaxID=106549 RepID=A0A540MBV9_MALBA|nr:hypothetical protein C1H46_018132 [Malus baccata]